MTPLKMGHLGLHVRDLEEEIAFLKLLGAEVTSTDMTPRGRIAFVSLDGVWHHNFALFEDGTPLESGDSQREDRGIDPNHLAFEVEHRSARIAAVDRGIGLDEVVIGAGIDIAMARRDDTCSDRTAEAVRVADRDHPLADAGTVGITE